MASKKTKKTQEPHFIPPSPKVRLVALKPVLKAEDKPAESSPPIEPVEPPTSAEPPVPVETPKSIEPPTPVAQTQKILKPIKRALTPSVELDSSLPVQEDAIFQGVGIIVGDVTFSDKKAYIKISEKEYPLFYASSHKKAFEALRLELKNTGQPRQRLIVYPKILHFPKKEQPYLIGFQVVSFEKNLEKNLEKPQTPNNAHLTLNRELQDFEFKLSGLWQFIPVCQTPCITVQKNFSDERLTYIKEAPIEQKVNFMKASHIPVLWRDAPIRPFRFNPKLDKQQQGQAFFVEIKVEFLPSRDVFEFRQLRSRPSQAPPKSLKAGKNQKAEALKAKNKRLKDKAQTSPKT